MQLPSVLDMTWSSVILASILACQLRAARLHWALVGARSAGRVARLALISASSSPIWRPARMKATRRSMCRG